MNGTTPIATQPIIRPAAGTCPTCYSRLVEYTDPKTNEPGRRCPNCDRSDSSRQTQPDPLAGFELYRGGSGRRHSNRVHVTLNRHGVLHLSVGAYTALGSPPAVQLLFDRKLRRLGLRPAEADAEHARACISVGKSGGKRVNVRGFCEEFGIPCDVNRALPAKVEHGVLILFVDDAGATP